MKTKKNLIFVIIRAVLLIAMFGFSPVMSIQTYAEVLAYGDFKYCVESNDEIAILGYKGSATSVTIPETIDGKKVTQIGSCAFEEMDIVNVTLPDSITKINYKAFAKCKKLETINFPDSLKVIGEYAFTTCHSLEEIKLGNQIESMGYCSFQLCISLTDITVPGTIKNIPDHAFHGCHSLNTLIFEEGVTSIEETAALNMFSIEKIVIPKSVTEIGDHALGYYYYAPNFIRIGDFTIYGAANTAAERYATENGFDFVATDSLAAVTGVSLDKEAVDLKIGDSIVLCATVAPSNAGDKAVTWSSDNEKVATVTDGIITAISEGTANISVTTKNGKKTASCRVTVIGDKAAETPNAPETPNTPETPSAPETPDTPDIKPAPKGDSIVDPATRTKYVVTKSSSKSGTVAFAGPANKKIKSVKIPDTVTIGGVTYKVTSIQPKAFSRCYGLNRVTIGKNVTTIGEKAFYKCTKLKAITIPPKVIKIGKSAFEGCKKLKTIKIKTTKLTSKKVGSKAFKGTPAKAKVTVPKKSWKSYKKFLYKKGLSKKATIKK